VPEGPPAWAQARDTLVEHRDRLERLARAVLTAETLDADQAYEAAGVPRTVTDDEPLRSAVNRPGRDADVDRSGDPVHLAVGLAGLALGRTLAMARNYGSVLAVGYGAAFVYGLIAVGETWDFLAINAADNWLHLISALVGLGIALGPVRSEVGTRMTRA
jgi:hypothetical protein